MDLIGQPEMSTILEYANLQDEEQRHWIPPTGDQETITYRAMPSGNDKQTNRNKVPVVYQ